VPNPLVWRELKAAPCNAEARGPQLHGAREAVATAAANGMYRYDGGRHRHANVHVHTRPARRLLHLIHWHSMPFPLECAAGVRAP